MTKDEALRLALEAFGEIAWSNETRWQSDRAKVAITAIKAALEAKDEPWECVCGANLYIDANGIPRSKASVEPATVMFKPEQEAKDEPVTENGLYRLGYHNGYGFGEAYGKANAPQRTWVGLTDEEIDEWTPEIHVVIQAIEAKLKEKNA